MIAGTYTALLSQTQVSVWAVCLITVVWVGAIAGASLKLFLPGRFDRLSILIYLGLGWSALAAVKPMIDSLPFATFLLVVVGGALYSIGVAFHLWESLKYQNVIWHAFVAAAAACHGAGVLQAVGP